MDERWTLDEVADQLEVPQRDVHTVAEVELEDDGEVYDAVDRTVNRAGREVIAQHFAGGADPE